MKNFIKLISVVLAFFMVSSCDDYLDIKPKGKVVPETVEDYRELITSAYGTFYSNEKYVVLTDAVKNNANGRNASELIYYYSWGAIAPENTLLDLGWDKNYKVIFYANAVINGVTNILEKSDEKDQLLAEAYALRAYVYFTLANLYGKPYDDSVINTKCVPIVLEADLEQNFKVASLGDVYKQVFSDLQKAKELVKIMKYSDGLQYRFSKSAIYALDARVNLYVKNYNKSLEATNYLLENNKELEDLNTSKVFPNSHESKETILALDNLTADITYFGYYLSDKFVDLYDKANDLRFDLFYEEDRGNYRTVKFRSSRKRMTFRTSELYLNKSELLLMLNKLDESKTVLLEFLKNRYNSTHYNTVLKDKVLGMSQKEFEVFLFDERARELTFEGHRWFDLRRTTQPEIIHSYEKKVYTLKKSDPRYTLTYPKSVKLSNPEL